MRKLARRLMILVCFVPSAMLSLPPSLPLYFPLPFLCAAGQSATAGIGLLAVAVLGGALAVARRRNRGTDSENYNPLADFLATITVVPAVLTSPTKQRGVVDIEPLMYVTVTSHVCNTFLDFEPGSSAFPLLSCSHRGDRLSSAMVSTMPC